MDIIHSEKYYKQIQKRFPFLSIKQIDKIAKYGLRAFFYINSAGGDVLFNEKYYTAYFGKLFFDSKLFWKYKRFKQAIKYRLKDACKRKPYAGRYYFVVNKEWYESEYINKKNGKSYPRHVFHFDKLHIYRLYEEASLQWGDYIFEFDCPEDIGYHRLMRKFTVRNIRLVGKRDGIFHYAPIN